MALASRRGGGEEEDAKVHFIDLPGIVVLVLASWVSMILAREREGKANVFEANDEMKNDEGKGRKGEAAQETRNFEGGARLPKGMLCVSTKSCRAGLCFPRTFSLDQKFQSRSMFSPDHFPRPKVAQPVYVCFSPRRLGGGTPP